MSARLLHPGLPDRAVGGDDGVFFEVDGVLWCDGKPSTAPSPALSILGRRGERRCDLALPLGAQQASSLRPWPRGRGLCWASADWVYRSGPHGLDVPARHRGLLCCGAHGALLTGADGWLGWGAAPDLSAVALEVPLCHDAWGVRFSDDGQRVRGVDPDGNCVTLALRDGALLHTQPAPALPVDGEALTLCAGELRHRGVVQMRGLAEASWARRGSLLAGPGGVCWDLSLAQPCFSAPCVLLGATVATPADWATVDWESGVGHWFHPRTGQIGARFELPLTADDLVSGGALVDNELVFQTCLGAAYRVRGVEVTPTKWSPTLPDDPETGGTTLDDIRWRWARQGWLIRG